MVYEDLAGLKSLPPGCIVRPEDVEFVNNGTIDLALALCPASAEHPAGSQSRIGDFHIEYFEAIGAVTGQEGIYYVLPNQGAGIVFNPFNDEPMRFIEDHQVRFESPAVTRKIQKLMGQLN